MPDREPFGAATVTPPAQRRMGPLAERAGEEHAAALRERRSRRLRKVTGTLLVAAAFVAVLISLSKRSQPTATERVIDAQVRSALSGVPQSGTRLGAAAAPVTVTYFGDLECPVCSQLTLGGGFPQLLARDVREGRVKVVYRSLCTATCSGPGEQVFDAQQVAAYAAGAQDRFWYYAELFYREQGLEDSGYVTAAYLARIAAQIPGLDTSAWVAARRDPALLGQVRSDGAAAARLGIGGTPTLVVTGPRGRRTLSGVAGYGDIEQAIRQVAPPGSPASASIGSPPQPRPSDA